MRGKRCKEAASGIGSSVLMLFSWIQPDIFVSIDFIIFKAIARAKIRTAKRYVAVPVAPDGAEGIPGTAIVFTGGLVATSVLVDRH